MAMAGGAAFAPRSGGQRLYVANRRARGFVGRSTVAMRNFMSKQFHLKEEWGARLKSPIFGKIEMSKYFFEIDRKFQRENRGSAIDADIFANAIMMPDRTTSSSLTAEKALDRLDQLREILRRLRRTPQTNMTLPSTAHAVVRAHLEVADLCTEEAGSRRVVQDLLKILDSRREFGMFLDDYSLVLLLDRFVESSSWKDAAKTAVTMMLQEEFRIPVAAEAGLLATFNYARGIAANDPLCSSELWRDPIDGDPKPNGGGDDDEEVKVRVHFVDNDYNDDHFDLVDRDHLVGKTLASFARFGSIGDESPVASRSLELLGWTLFQKWDKVAGLLSADKETFSNDCFDLIHSLMAASGGEAPSEQQKAALELLQSVKDSARVVELDTGKVLEEQLAKAVKKHEESLTKAQAETFKRWNRDRELELERQHQEYLRETRLERLDQAKRELKEQQERLFFFENYSDMEREKRDRFVEWRKTWPKKSGIRHKPKQEDDGALGAAAEGSK